MELHTSKLWKGKNTKVIYRDIDHVDELGGRVCMGVRAYCFNNDKLVVTYSQRKDIWEPAGGNVEIGELVTDAMIREVREETNMQVVRHACIGYEDIYAEEGIVTLMRFVCIGEPYGDFIEDPDEKEVTKIESIDPGQYKDYFDWKDIGDHMLVRALTIKEGWKQ